MHPLLLIFILVGITYLFLGSSIAGISDGTKMQKLALIFIWGYHATKEIASDFKILFKN